MRTVVLVLTALLVAGCSDDELAVQARRLAHPPRPADARAVQPGDDLQAVVDASPEGTALVLLPGVHRGPLTLPRRLTLWGSPEAVVRSHGEGSTISVPPAAAGSALLGFTVDGSGGRFDLTDAAVRVRADRVRLEGLTVKNALFGILLEQCNGLVVRGNRVLGHPDKPLGLRGDGVRLWEVRDSRVEDNHVTDSRDVVVWYSRANHIAGNTVERSRYGTHFMYSHDNVVEDNWYVANTVGVFLMYSRGVTLRHNLLAQSAGAAGLGLGLKESGNVTVEGNVLLDNSVAIHLDNSPIGADEHNRFAGNLLQLSDTAVVFNGIATRTTFAGNAFKSNLAQVRVDGGDDAMGVEWRGNDFDDYRGYDFDGDGTGDVPYELRSLSLQVTTRHPDLQFFRGTPALWLLDVSSSVLPLFQPKRVLVDPAPSMALGRPWQEVCDAR